MKLREAFLLLVFASTTLQVFSQNTGVTQPGELVGQQRAITTAVPFVGITPDARHAALGDAGVATSPDANAAYWNAGKLVFIEGQKLGGSFSYTPWLGKIVNDMWISSLAGFYKIGREQAIGVSLKYFDLGEISFRGNFNEPLGDFNPKEAAFDVTYSRKLTEELGIGLTARYIFSNLTGAFTGPDAQAGNSVAADLGVYYTKLLQGGTRNSTLSLGGQISNIGAKISYTNNNNKDFLPTNLRLGGTYMTELDIYNNITFILDFNKLMVPSPGADRDTVSLLSGMFGSFSDAPGGAKEEFQEFMTSVGIEYWYRNIFAGRIGYFNENINKGNRKYLTLGVGFRKESFGIDVAYVVPTNQREHPLAETLRFTLLMHINSRTVDEDETVTEP
ncbi:MAG: type IX secretion system outer membrane channel protein PorV [Cyclobacteriaceae bacterium]